MEFVNYWDLKQCQKRLKDCNESERLVIGVGHLNNTPEIKIGENTYIEKFSIADNYVSLEKLQETMPDDFLVISLDDLNRQRITEIDFDIARTLQKQSTQLKKQQKMIEKTKDIIASMAALADLHNERCLSDAHVAKQFKENLKKLNEIID